MKKIIIIVFLSALIFKADAQRDFAIIVNSNVPVESLTISELKNVYLGQKTIWKNKTRMKPSYIRNTKSFWTSSGINMSLVNFQRHWTKKIYSGYGVAPANFSDDEAVIKYVSNMKGGIGIISKSAIAEIGSKCKVITLN